jgi:hypothetical protein
MIRFLQRAQPFHVVLTGEAPQRAPRDTFLTYHAIRAQKRIASLSTARPSTDGSTAAVQSCQAADRSSEPKFGAADEPASPRRVIGEQPARKNLPSPMPGPDPSDVSLFMSAGQWDANVCVSSASRRWAQRCSRHRKPDRISITRRNVNARAGADTRLSLIATERANELLDMIQPAIARVTGTGTGTPVPVAVPVSTIRTPSP